jgi:curved DNA-binding protein CbpA
VNPYEVLGLRAEDQVTDDDVRAAWRRIASATHPDREDGGDAGRFALAAAAYHELRTEYGRNEAKAARAEAERGPMKWPVRSRRLAQMAAITLAGAAGALAAPDTATRIALITGAITWLALTALSRAP